MAIWTVEAQKIELLPHPNADRMEIGKIGMRQIVVGKDNYKNGDIVVFAPDKSILPDSLKSEYVNQDTGKSYLSGPDQNRVREVKLRGELSEGIALPISWSLERLNLSSVQDIPLGVDLAPLLGITKYEPPIPQNMEGTIKSFDSLNFNAHPAHHDVEQFRIFADEFSPDESCVVGEKVHGSQCNVYLPAMGLIGISSKGFNNKDQIIEESEGNFYWTALKNSGITDHFCEYGFDLRSDIQLVGEAIPCQGANYSYGQTKPNLKLFRMLINGVDQSLDQVRALFGEDFVKDHWVPILYEGKFDVKKFEELCTGMEHISGKSLHIKEGIVITPKIPRKASKGFYLAVKFLNPKYKSSDEAFS